MSDSEKVLDQMAAAALTGLISKMPFYDSEGKYGKEVPQEELTEIKKTLTATAYEYAGYMLIARESAKDWVKDNRVKNSNFGM